LEQETQKAKEVWLELLKTTANKIKERNATKLKIQKYSDRDSYVSSKLEKVAIKQDDLRKTKICLEEQEKVIASQLDKSDKENQILIDGKSKSRCLAIKQIGDLEKVASELIDLQTEKLALIKQLGELTDTYLDQLHA